MIQERGSMLLELVIGAAMTCAISAVLFQFAIAAQGALAVQGNAADQQQRLRVAVEALRHDLMMAGAGLSRGPGMGPIVGAFAPVMPARLGIVSPDPELTVRADRIAIVYVPETRAQTILRSGMTASSSPLAIDANAPGCVAGTACDFAAGDRAVVFEPPGGGGAHEFFTVASADTARALLLPAAALAQPYAAGARVALVTIRTYYLDAPTKRLMVYDGDGSDVPLVDRVADLRVELVADPAAGALTAAQLSDGPFAGASPDRFDTDLLRVRRVRVTIRLEADSSPARVGDLTATIDVAPPNLAAR